MRKVLWELPHWVPWLAGVLRAAGFRELEVLDLYGDCALVDDIDDAAIARRLGAADADVYLFSPMTINLPHALRIASMVKAGNPAATTVFGGVVATPLHSELAGRPEVDYVVRDRGEIALPALLSALWARSGVEQVPNLSFRDAAGDAVTTPLCAPLEVSRIPFPMVDIFPPDTGLDLRYIRLNYALGCPFDCSFCTIQTIGRKPSYFPLERVIAEAEAYRAHLGDHHHVYFGDETFTVHPGRTAALCDALTRHGDITYDCQTRVSALRDLGVFAQLWASGCRWLELGLESASPATQAALKQHTDLRQLESTLAAAADAGIAVCTYVIVGLPGESVDDMRRTVDWVASLIDRRLLVSSYLSVFVPYPGTAMFATPQRYGMRLRHRRFELYSEELPPVLDSDTADADRVYEVYLAGLGVLSEAMTGGRVPSQG
ncbi:radical SAM protein [Nocardia vinacea]|uniref:B12-binding domain-containing radical SAM protein n=1 Tax=Nocardia vinacea TaxID=96468 RepID=UPI0033C58D38